MASAEEKVTQLREIAHIDDEVARRLLVATNWSLEEAVGLHLAGATGESMVPGPMPDPTFGGYSGLATTTPVQAGGGVNGADGQRRKRPTESDSEEEEALATQTAAQEEEGWFAALGSRASGVFQSVFGVASEDFEHWFVSRFGKPAPAFSQVSFGETVRHALDHERLVLLWFHQAEDAATEAMCRQVLQNPLVLRMIRRGMVLWAGDVSRFEPAQIARLLSVSIYPSIVVSQPLRSSFDVAMFCVEWPMGTFTQPLFRLSPEAPGLPLNADQAVATLTSAAEDHYDAVEGRQAETRRREARAAEDRRLREEQDREFEESLLADQIAAVRRSEEELALSSPEASRSPAQAGMAVDIAVVAEVAAAEEAAATEAAVAAAAARAEEEAKAKQEEERLIKGQEIRSRVEPTAADNPIARISLKLVAGERMQRTFLAADPVQEVYDWAHCCRPTATPWNFELCTSFPVKALTERMQTLQEAGLSPSAALLMKSLDD